MQQLLYSYTGISASATHLRGALQQRRAPAQNLSLAAPAAQDPAVAAAVAETAEGWAAVRRAARGEGGGASGKEEGSGPPTRCSPWTLQFQVPRMEQRFR
jgi:hypothetical protein